MICRICSLLCRLLHRRYWLRGGKNVQVAFTLGKAPGTHWCLKCRKWRI